MLLKILSILKRKPKKKKNEDQWFIAIKRRGDSLFDLSNLTELEAPPGTYWADPFLVEWAGKTYLFFEDYDYQKAVISVAEVVDMKVVNHRVILNEKKHLSFPAVFRDQDSFYMTPERSRAKKLVIYKAKNFPDRWDKFSVVAKGKYDDPVLRKTNEGYEVWATEGGNNLVVFFAIHLKGPWKLIRQEEVPHSRSAGHFIGNLRPVQDLSKIYGGAIKFKLGNEIQHTINPDWSDNLNGTHTFNISENYLVVDGRRPFRFRKDIFDTCQYK